MPKPRIDHNWEPVTAEESASFESGRYTFELPPLEPGRVYTIEFRQKGPSGNPQFRILSRSKGSDSTGGSDG